MPHRGRFNRLYVQETRGKLQSVPVSPNAYNLMDFRRYTTAATALTITALAIAFAPSVATASPGALDPTFGSGGVVGVGPQLFGDAAQANGSVLAVGGNGSSTTLRLTSSGQSDGSFGSGGQATGPAGVGRGVALQTDGKVVTVGGGAGMIVERFNGNGTPDSGFGASGVVSLLAAQGGAANAVAIAPGGKIVVVGSELGGDGLTRVAVARLNPNGSLDTSFGAGGTELLDLGPYSAAYGVAVQADGKTVLVGNQRPDLRITNGFVARLNTSGSLDGGFGGSSGPLTCGPGVCFYFHPGGGAASSLNAVALQNDGKIVAAGVDIRSQNAAGEPLCATGDCPHAIVARVNSNGTSDTGFGAGGVAALPSGLQTSTADLTGAYGVGIGGGGDIIAAGDYQDEIGGQVALWAFTPAGAPDSRFGSGGTVLTPLPGNAAHGRGLAVAPDGSLLVAGQDGTGGFVARYIGLGPPPTGGGGGGGGGGTAPSVATGTAASGPRTARLSGSVNPQGQQTTYLFQFGSTTAYGSTTSAGSAGSASGTVNVSQSLRGLRPGTTYHYRLVAANASGQSAGGDRTFRTPSFTVSSPTVSGARLIKTIVSGLQLGVRCNDACTIHASLLVSAKEARKLHLRKGSVTIGTGSGSLRGSGTAHFRVRLAKGLGGAVSSQSNISVTLRIVISSPARRGTVAITEHLSFKR